MSERQERLADAQDLCDCGDLQPCPHCGELICLNCEDWQRFHTVRNWVYRQWWHHVARRFVR